MKARITNQPAISKTREELDNLYSAIEEMEEMELAEAKSIRKTGCKKVVSPEKYSNHLDTENCAFCMNYVDENDTCKKSMPFIDPFYIKNNNILDSCQEWDYIYTTENGD